VNLYRSLIVKYVTVHNIVGYVWATFTVAIVVLVCIAADYPLQFFSVPFLLLIVIFHR
jgi:hypothetical protein